MNWFVDKELAENMMKGLPFRSLELSDMNRWYGPNWWISGPAMLGVFAIAVVLPGILG